MYFLFDEIGLIIVLIGSFFGGFLPLMILLMLTPEARAHIKCRVTGGIIVEKFYDTGQCEYVVAKSKGGEGQYIAGKNAFGQREIYVKPRMSAPLITKPFLLSGMRRLKFFAYAGKTPIVNHETLMAIETVESPEVPFSFPNEFVNWINKKYPAVLPDFYAKANDGGSELRQKDLPPEVREWASLNFIPIQENVYGKVDVPAFSEPDANGLSHFTGTKTVTQVVDHKDVFYNLLSLDARKLKNYFSGHNDQSQIDNLMEEQRLVGYSEGREGKKFVLSPLAKIAIAFIVIAVVGVLVVLGLQGGL